MKRSSTNIDGYLSIIHLESTYCVISNGTFLDEFESPISAHLYAKLMGLKNYTVKYTCIPDVISSTKH